MSEKPKAAAETAGAGPELKFDPNNYNRGTSAGNALIGKSMDEVGFLRSGVAAANGTLIAGNKSYQKVAERGGSVRFVHTRGDEYVVVVRYDIADENDPRFRVAALADNRTSEANLDWNVEALLGDFSRDDLADWNMESLLPKEANLDDPGIDYKNQFGVIVMCRNEAEQEALYNRLAAEGLNCKIVVV